MRLPFQKIFRRPGLRRIILPLTLGLAMVATVGLLMSSQ